MPSGLGTPSIVFAVLVLASLAGCAEERPRGEGAVHDEVGWRNPLVSDHDHTEIHEHGIANNMSLVGHSYLTPQGPPGLLGEMEVAAGHAYVAIIGHGFAILDLSDPARPETRSITSVPSLRSLTGVSNPVLDRFTADLKVDASGDWVFLAMQLSETPGVLLYDARDRANPVFSGIWAIGLPYLGCHMIEHAVINEAEYLFCAPLDHSVWVGRLLPALPGTPHREVQTVGRWIPDAQDLASEVAPHATDPVTGANPLGWVPGHQDMTYQEDPLTGAPTLFASFWDLGVRIVDVSIPSLPQEVAAWDGQGSDVYLGDIHTTRAFASDGRRIVVAVSESSHAALYVLDATDLDAPVLLGTWQGRDENGDVTRESMHNFQLIQGRVYMAMYHGGVWVLDVSTPRLQAAPKVLGTHLLDKPLANGTSAMSQALDVVVWNGYLLVSDIGGYDLLTNDLTCTGVYVMRYDGDARDDPELMGSA